MELVTKQLLNSHLEILIPADFRRMKDEMLKTKYPNETRPTLVFSNLTGTVSIAINHTHWRVSPVHLDGLHKQLETSVREAHPRAKWICNEIRESHGRRWVQLCFVTSAVDTKIHNIMLATAADERMLAISFNVTDELSQEWLPIGNKIVSSVVFID